MAQILFKKGVFADFNSKVVANNQAVDGALYLTTDEGGLYLGLDTGKVKRISGSVIWYPNLAKFEDSVKPPYSTDVIYFLADSNSLVRYNGTKWIILNETPDTINAELKTIKEDLAKEIQRATGIETGLRTDVDLKLAIADFDTFKETNSAAIADAKKAGTDAQTTANAAKSAAEKNATDISGLKDDLANTDKVAKAAVKREGDTMTGDLTMPAGTKIVLTDAPTAATSAANKKYVDDTKSALETSIADVKKTAEKGVSDAAAVASDLADTKEDVAKKMPIAGGTFTGMVTLSGDPTEDLHAATKQYVDTKVSGVTTDLTSVKSDITQLKTDVKTAQAAAKAAQTTANAAVSDAAAANTAAGKAQTAADNAQKTANANAEAIKGLVTNTTFESFKEANTAEIKKAADAAAAAQETANQGVSDAAEALSAAQDAMKEAQKKTTMSEVEAKNYATKTEAKGYADAVLGTADDTAESKTVMGAFAAIAALGSADTKLNEDIAKAQARADEAYTLAEGKTTMAEVEKKGYATVTQLNTAVSGLKGTAEDASTADTVMGAKKGVEEAKAAAADAASDAANAQKTANAALPKAGGTMTGNIAMGNHKITGLAAPTADGDATNKKYVDDEIAAKLKAADAMTFKGVVDATHALPTTGVQKGDTYKVGASGTYADVVARVGDLFINQGEDDATPDWVHVTSGYEDDYLQKLVISGNTVYLTDGINADNTNAQGKFTVQADSNSSVTVAVNPTTATITVGMEWGSF